MAAKCSDLKRELRALSDPRRALGATRFFKTGPGQYGEGDIFLGLSVPQVRSLAKKFQDLSLAETLKLLPSKYHEERLTALILLIQKYRKGSPSEQKKIFDAYLKNRKHINNWDLIDVSTPSIVGAHLYQRPRKILYQLARSKSLWDRRISILATHYFIRQGEVTETMTMARLHLQDSEDLIHKAVGWMLREAGKRNQPALRRFLQELAPVMPRTMLRYSLEKLSEKERQKFMRLKKAP